MEGLEFSVVVPTFNRPNQLSACLDALAGQDYPRSAFEIIVVDDGGTCGLDSAARAAPPGVAFSLLRQAHSGPAAARNLGAALARGTRLAFTDDDCRPAGGWLAGLARAMDGDRECAVGGRTLNGAPGSPFATASQSILDAVYRHYNSDPGGARFFASLNLAVPAAAFRALGGFDGRFRTSEDREFCDRWLGNGRRIAYAPEAIVRHDSRRTLASFWGQHFQYGRGGRRFRRLASLRSGNPKRLELSSFYLGLFCAPVREGVGPRSLLIALLVVLSQAASACGYCMESLQPLPAPDPRSGGDGPAPINEESRP